MLSAPQLYSDSSQIAGPSSAIDLTYPPSSASPPLGLFIPGLSVPSTSGSLGLLSLPSLASVSRAPSPAMSDIGLLSLPLKRQRLTNSGAYRSVSQPVTAGSMLSPLIGVHWPTNQTWTDADQADWEAGLAWLHAVHVHDASGDSHNAEELLKQIIELINQVESEWGVIIIACTTDASGESHKAWRLLCAKFPHLVTPDCLAHQFNLIVGDLFKAKDDYGQYGDLTQYLITWLRSKTHVLALLCALQMSMLGKTLAIIRAVLTRWLSHYLAYRRLLDVRPTLELLITKHKADIHMVYRWKNLLEPIALMTNIHQAAHLKPEHIPISFGCLYYRYSRIGDESDLVARNAVLESAERRWAQVDQEVFIATVIVNPLYKDKPFSNIPLTTCAGLMSLFSHLWTRFYGVTPPLELFTDLDNYIFESSPEFQPLDIYTRILVSCANDQGTPVDPLDIWDGFSHSNSEIKPLQKIAHIFGAILTKWRNWPSTQNLMLLAELKMYLHEEHVHMGSVRKRLNWHYCQNTTSEVNQSAESS
ncbi:hypothetical protein BDR03DRAFT_1014523 [Suillus americanus]|nr:hypothetical protein BDR03DRAFT_1014523 [Suillus americanus]